MASYRQVDNANHKDVHTYAPGAGIALGASVTGVSSSSNTYAVETDVQTTAAATSPHSTADPTSATSPSLLSGCSNAFSVQRSQSIFAPSEPTGRTKIIVGAASAAAIITLLAAMSLFWVYQRRQTRRRRRRRAHALTMTPPHSPLLETHGHDQAKESISEKDVGWVRVETGYWGKTSPRTSFDSGLGVVLVEDARKTNTRQVPSPNCRSQSQAEAQTQAQTQTQPKRHSGGPLSSNPPDGPSFGQPSKARRQAQSQSQSPDSSQSRQEIDNDHIRPAMPVMGAGALTAKSSDESLTTVLQMQPRSPRHRQLTPTKSCLKKSSPPAFPPPSFVIPAPVASIEHAEPEVKPAKVSSLRKAMGSLVKPKKELKIVIAIEQPQPQPMQEKPRKGVRFGEDTVRRISRSPETDEGDWQTIDSKTDDGEQEEADD